MDKVDPVMNRDVTAAYLSIIPGLGHLYKHQFRKGLVIISIGNVIVGLVTGLLSIATLGVGLIVMPVLWIGWAAYDAEAQAALGVREGEKVAGFIHIGTAQERPPDRIRPDLDELITDWSAGS